MIIRLHNVFTALNIYKAQRNIVKKAPLTYSEKVRYDRIATVAITVLIIIASVLYTFFTGV